MKKITVVGAGIGGLTAAANLAENGFDVTVIESKEKRDLGYDWCDSVAIDAFALSGIKCPDSSGFTPQLKMCYRNSSKSKKIVSLTEPGKNLGYIDRRFLAEYLVEYAMEKGVKFQFNTNVLSALMNENAVTGVIIENNGKKETILCDLVIDAAGIDSTVRNRLPVSSGISNDADNSEILYAYRAYYDKKSDVYAELPFGFYFFHCRRKGVDWVITEKDYIDILVGGIGSLSQEEIDEAVSDFRAEYPYIGDNIVRGGTVAKIPLGRTRPVIVYNGYAAVGDSAVMVEPLSGSGISLSMLAGKLLADKVIDIKDGDYSAKNLWSYQYDYFKQYGEKRISADIIKGMLTSITADELDYLFEKRILAEKELSGGGAAKNTVSDNLSKAFYLVLRPKLLMLFAKVGLSMLKQKSVCSSMPKDYDKQKINQWQKKYLKL